MTAFELLARARHDDLQRELETPLHRATASRARRRRGSRKRTRPARLLGLARSRLRAYARGWA